MLGAKSPAPAAAYSSISRLIFFDQSLTLLGTPQAITADVRIERTGFTTDDAFDILLHYANDVRALLRATMMSAVPRPRLVVFGEKGSYLKREFDPLEPTLRAGEIPQGPSWVVEKPENYGELTTIENAIPTTRKIPSTGDWREFYANIRDAIDSNVSAPSHPPTNPKRNASPRIDSREQFETHHHPLAPRGVRKPCSRLRIIPIPLPNPQRQPCCCRATIAT